MTRAEIDREQAHVDRAYARLEEMIADSRRWSAEAAGNRWAAGPRRDALVESGLRRATQLDIGDEALVFGRTDATDGERLHIGRVAVYDEHHDPLVTDWRAPVAESFYRATPTEPMGLVRRRHIVCRGRKVLRLDDELLGEPSGEQVGLELVGEGALLDALRRARTGRMRDIVATIQAEQDAVIRAPLEGVLVVQGGPGTGKTAVALHRAAYLLYTHRERLERTGVLMVGPSSVFLRYIAQVLPSLGESAELATVAELAGIAVTATDHERVALLKGDARMAAVVARAVERLPRPLGAPVEIPYEGTMLRLSVAESRRIVELAHQRLSGRHNARRPDVEGFVVTHLWRGFRKQARETVEILGDEARRHFERSVRSERAFARTMDAMWPVLTGAELVDRLLSSPDDLAGTDALDDEERELLRRPRGAGLTEADAALVDEAGVHLGPPGSRERKVPTKVDEEDRWMVERMLDDLQAVDPVIRAERKMLAERYAQARRELEERPGRRKRPSRFGHVIVDEAQGLSPMQWRMIRRRCRSDSMTIVGDLGQAGGFQPDTWDQVLAHLGAEGSRVAELTINYRTPAEIMELAAGVLKQAAPELEAPRSVRATGESPVVRRVAADELVAEVARAALSERERVADGKVAVVTTPVLAREVAETLGVHADDPAKALDEPVVVLGVDDARGLEFDSVVVAEPAAIVGETAGGLRALYVALTRTTEHLVVVHAEDLPAGLSSDGSAELRVS